MTLRLKVLWQQCKIKKAKNIQLKQHTLNTKHNRQHDPQHLLSKCLYIGFTFCPHLGPNHYSAWRGGGYVQETKTYNHIGGNKLNNLQENIICFIVHSKKAAQQNVFNFMKLMIKLQPCWRISALCSTRCRCPDEASLSGVLKEKFFHVKMGHQLCTKGSCCSLLFYPRTLQKRPFVFSTIDCLIS